MRRIKSKIVLLTSGMVILSVLIVGGVSLLKMKISFKNMLTEFEPTVEGNMIIFDQYYKEMMLFIAILSIIVVLMCIVISYLFGNSFYQYIKVLTTFSNKLAGGRLTDALDKKSLQRKDELGILGKTITKMRHNLASFIYYIQHSAWKVKEYLNELKETSNEVLLTTNEVSQQVVNMSAKADQHLMSSKNLLNNISKLEHTMEENNTYTADLAKLYHHINESTSQGVLSMHLLAETTVTNEIEANAVLDNIQQTVLSSKNISEVNDKFKRVAKRTNLVALNAAIEAAHAGREGQGFSVLASEMKEISDSISNYTKEMDESVDMLESNTNNVVGAMDHFNALLKDQAKRVSENRNSYDEIKGSIDEAMEIINELTKISKMLRVESDEVFKEAKQLTDTANENASHVNATSEIINELSDTMAQTFKASDELLQLASHLERNTKKFKI